MSPIKASTKKKRAANGERRVQQKVSRNDKKGRKKPLQSSSAAKPREEGTGLGVLQVVIHFEATGDTLRIEPGMEKGERKRRGLNRAATLFRCHDTTKKNHAATNK